MSNLYSVFETWQAQIGKIAGQKFNILRPDYTIVDNTPVTRFIGRKYKVEKTGSKLAQPSLPGLEYYVVFGNRDLFQPGDILQRTQSNSSTPDVTILSYSPIEECIAFRTSRTGTLKSGQTDVYTNIKFEFVNRASFLSTPLDPRVEAALGIPGNNAVMWRRELITATRDGEGLVLYETDKAVQRRWTVVNASELGDLMILTLNEAVIS